MPTPGGPTRQTRDTEHEPDYEQLPADHYRGRGGDQSNTGPAGSALREGTAAFQTPPSGAPSPSHEEHGRQPHGAALAQRVRDALRNHGDVDANAISIEVSGGDVTLRGTARSRLGKFVAENLTRAVDGVTSVENEIQILRTADGSVAEEGPSTETSNPMFSSDALESKK